LTIHDQSYYHSQNKLFLNQSQIQIVDDGIHRNKRLTKNILKMNNQCTGVEKVFIINNTEIGVICTITCHIGDIIPTPSTKSLNIEVINLLIQENPSPTQLQKVWTESFKSLKIMTNINASFWRKRGHVCLHQLPERSVILGLFSLECCPQTEEKQDCAKDQQYYQGVEADVLWSINCHFSMENGSS